MAGFEPMVLKLSDDMTSTIVGSQIQILAVNPGDIVVLSYPGKLTLAARDSIRSIWQSLWPGRLTPTLVILEEGMKLDGILRAASEDGPDNAD